VQIVPQPNVIFIVHSIINDGIKRLFLNIINLKLIKTGAQNIKHIKDIIIILFFKIFLIKNILK
jgi:hypothetical protein